MADYDYELLFGKLVEEDFKQLRFYRGNKISQDIIKKLLDKNSTVDEEDFQDIWWIGDYSDVNTGSTAGYLAIHLINALNTDGIKIQSADKEKGQFAFNFTGHYSMDSQDTVPYEIYIKAGTE